MEMRCGANTKKPPEGAFPRKDVKTDSLVRDMPLNLDEVRYLCPKADDLLTSKPWIVSMPEGKQGQALYALSNRSFTLHEEIDRVIVKPKID